MKRIVCLTLCLCLLLSGCGHVQPESERQMTEPELPQLTPQEETREGSSKDYLSYVIANAQLPEIPDRPSESEWETFAAEHDYSRMGAEAYEKAQDEFVKDYEARYRAYSDAVNALRGDGVSEEYFAGFLHCTQETGKTILTQEKDKNIVYSPANIYLTLSMLTAVTDGDSREQVEALLGQEDEKTIAEAASSVWRQLYQKNDECSTLLANSLWLQKGIQYNQKTIEQLTEDYFASGFAVPMGTTEADRAMQSWVNENTGGLLQDSVGNLQTDKNTVLALISTLYFQDSWSQKFFKENTEMDEFTSADGKKQAVPFMELDDRRDSFARDNERGYTVAQLRFQNGAAMRFLLPDECVPLSSLLADGTVVGALLGFDMGVARMLGEIDWNVPKFDISTDLELTDTLKALGITDVFDDTCSDFSPLGSFNDLLVVSQVQHSARVMIDEEGCEAAAYSAIMVEATAALAENLPEIDMDLDRPFAFMITGVQGLPLFLGVVNTME